MLLVYITVPDAATARSLGRLVVEEGLAACVNIIDGMESCYWWEGKVESAVESVCLCKTAEERYPALEKRVAELHPYDVPCIVALPFASGYAPFMQWIADATKTD